jgi:hypothetical protein
MAGSSDEGEIVIGAPVKNEFFQYSQYTWSIVIGHRLRVCSVASLVSREALDGIDSVLSKEC